MINQIILNMLNLFTKVLSCKGNKSNYTMVNRKLTSRKYLFIL
jgi:hypothetical protein